MRIRRAVIEDAAELARLRWEFLSEEAAQSAQTFEEFLADFEAFWRSPAEARRWAVWVAEDEGRLAGNMWVQRIRKVPHPGQPHVEYGYLTNVYVEPRCQGSGLGTELLTAVIEGSRECGLEFLIVWPSRRSVTFYERAGFNASGEAFELQLCA